MSIMTNNDEFEIEGKRRAVLVARLRRLFLMPRISGDETVLTKHSDMVAIGFRAYIEDETLPMPEWDGVNGHNVKAWNALMRAKEAVMATRVYHQQDGWRVEILFAKKQKWLVDRPYAFKRPPWGGYKVASDPNARLTSDMFSD